MNIEWNAQKYTSDFSFVHKYGNDVIELIDKCDVKSILDLGCGNGALTKLFGDMGFNVTGIDASEKMLEIARSSYPEIEFICADATDFTLDKPVDVVFSNAVFHWIDKNNQQNMMKCVYNSLNNGGQFVFEMGGIGNTALIHQALSECFSVYGYSYKMPCYFPSIGEYSSLLETVGFKVRYAVLFDRLTELKGEKGLSEWIRMFVKSPFSCIEDDKVKSEIIEKAAEKLKNNLYIDNKWHADYVRLRIKCIKEY